MTGRELNSAEDLVPFDGAPKIHYLVCTTPRCGGSYLCNLLSETGVLGKPLEYYNPYVQLPRLFERFGSEDIEVVTEQLKRLRTTSNGVFGFKCHFDQFQHLNEHVDISSLFPRLRYIHVYRKDVLRQAISFYRAKASGIWSVYEDPGPSRKVRFDFSQIELAMNDICRKNAGWIKFFALSNTDRIDISYESLMRNPLAQARKVARFVGVDPDFQFQAPYTKPYRRRDPTAEKWVQIIQRHQIRNVAGVCSDLYPGERK